MNNKVTKPPLKILHVTHDWGDGGAAIGARRLYNAMKKYGIECEMLVAVNNHIDNPEPKVHSAGKLRLKLAIMFYRFLNRRHKTGNPTIKSFNLMPTGLADVINKSDADIVQCHWLGANTLSIPELSKIKKPIFWKLADMWAISGAEHYDLHDDIPRYELGYTPETRQPHESGFDLNKWIWRYKKWHWSKKKFNVHIACPSSWLTGCVKKSIIFKDRPVRHILNPIDTHLFKPKDRLEALRILDLETLADKKIIAFGSDAAMISDRKGYPYLLQAIKKLSKSNDVDNYAIIIFGGLEKETLTIEGIPTYSLGRIYSLQEITSVYSCADVFVLPTLRDNLPNVIKEAMVCGAPCTGFNIGGMPDMIDHLKNGYLAQPFCPDDLAKGIEWTLKNISQDDRASIRSHAKNRHSELKAVKNYLDYYQVALGKEHAGLNYHIQQCEKL